MSRTCQAPHDAAIGVFAVSTKKTGRSPTSPFESETDATARGEAAVLARGFCCCSITPQKPLTDGPFPRSKTQGGIRPGRSRRRTWPVAGSDGGTIGTSAPPGTPVEIHGRSSHPVPRRPPSEKHAPVLPEAWKDIRLDPIANAAFNRQPTVTGIPIYSMPVSNMMAMCVTMCWTDWIWHNIF